MKRCPECRRDYYDDSLLYCLDDGSALLEGPAAPAGEQTAIISSSEDRKPEVQQGELPTIPSEKKPSTSPAHDLYFQGKFYSSRENDEDNQRAMALFEQAVELDPSHALSWAELARACGMRFFYFEGNKDLLAKGHASLQRAFAINPDLAQAHEVKGMLIWGPANGFPHEQAIAELQVALALDPDLVEAHNWLAAVYFHIGLLEEAEAELRTTLRLDPSKNMARFHIAMVQSFAGRYKEALYAFRSLPAELNPALIGSTRAWCLLSLGRIDEAAELVEQMLAEYPGDVGGQFTGLKTLLFALRGDAAAAEAAIPEAVEKGRGFGHFHHTTHYIADAYAVMERPVEAVRYLEQTADNGFPCYPLFASDPSLDPIRSDPRFEEFMAEQKAIWEHRAKWVREADSTRMWTSDPR